MLGLAAVLILHCRLKGECIRPGTPLSLEDARRLVEGYVEHYNNVRLNSAIGYITPKDMLAGHQQEIQAERDRKLDAAKGTAEESPPGGGVMDETECSRYNEANRRASVRSSCISVCARRWTRSSSFRQRAAH